ncbi:hypothetical protein B0I35DRAFT_181694 [Stachybotrys elegans]|uniref:Uncharacterized protein n=1 Tax=Stachybotrys elegans TaxID=80388 RepID=A0A8K0SCK5_9HYPO|nr:hypothetical protein B0I35DRAFT_181694 [Stachybotrys elegans]
MIAVSTLQRLGISFGSLVSCGEYNFPSIPRMSNKVLILNQVGPAVNGVNKPCLNWRRMSGFEALGVACLIFQVISFARETTAVCLAVYNGQQTPDAAFEEKAATMGELATEIESECQQPATHETKTLREFAAKVHTTADAVAREMQNITKHNKKGSAWKAIRVAAASLTHRRRIEDLDRTLSHYQSVMSQMIQKDTNF